MKKKLTEDNLHDVDDDDDGKEGETNILTIDINPLLRQTKKRKTETT